MTQVCPSVDILVVPSGSFANFSPAPGNVHAASRLRIRWMPLYHEASVRSLQQASILSALN